MTEPDKSLASKRAAKKTPAKKTAAAKSSAPSTAKTIPAKKTTAKKTTARKSSAPSTAKKTTPAKKTTAKKTTAKKTTAKKTAAKKSSAIKKALRLDAARELARSAPMSKYFAKARSRARKMIDDPETLKRIADESYRSGASRSGPFARVMDDFRTLVRLVVAYARGTYRDISPESLALIVGGLLYVVSPLDLIPDVVPVVGYADDAAVVGWVIKSTRQELEAFRAWELGQ